MDRRRATFGGLPSGAIGLLRQSCGGEFQSSGVQADLARNDHDDDALARRIAAARDGEASKRDASKREESQGWSIAVEFVGAMLVGGLIGWFIDRQAGTGPWGLIILLLLGFVTGLRSVLRQQKKFDGK